MKKKMLAVVLGMAMTISLMAGCGSKGDTTTEEKETYTIGISQFAEHGSLDNCREGFLAGLAEEGIVEGIHAASCRMRGSDDKVKIRM